MKRSLHVKFFVFLLILAVLAGCSSEKQFEKNDPTLPGKEENSLENDPADSSDSNSPENAPQETDPSQTDPIMEMIQQLTLEEKIGQLLMVGMEGTTVSEHSRMLIEKYHVGGMILFNDNIQNMDQTLSLLNDLKAINENNIPLFLSLDQEGGRVSRLPAEIVKFPAAGNIGTSDDRQLANEIGEMMGNAVAAFGFNMNYAPVLDINSNPQNPVIGDRAFGSTAQIVTDLGVATMKGIQSQQVIPVVKHFPGHGDTSVDSHLQLPEVEKGQGQLEEFELIPFASAIEQGADVVMVAHILMSQLDNQYPASLSEAVISGLLREDLQFDGVVITDDMTMGGITENFDMAEAAVKSLQAGSDIIMVAHEYANVASVFEALKTAVENGDISEIDLDQHVYRILELKQRYQLSDTATQQVDVEQMNQSIRSVLERVE